MTAKFEAVELVRREVRRMKERAQLIVDDIEVNKCEMTSQLDGGAGPTCDEAQWALSTIQPNDLNLLPTDSRHSPPHLVARVMDCVLIMFQRPLDAVAADEDRGCIRPSWNQSVKVRDVSVKNHYFFLSLFVFLLTVNVYSNII